MNKNVLREIEEEMSIFDVDGEFPTDIKIADCKDIKETGNVIDVTRVFMIHIKNEKRREELCKIMHTDARADNSMNESIDNSDTVAEFSIDLLHFAKVLRAFTVLEDRERVNVQIKKKEDENSVAFLIRMEGEDIVLYYATGEIVGFEITKEAVRDA